MKLDRTHADLRKAMPEFTYYLTVMYPDGEISTFERGIEILEVERNPETGGPIGASDITATFFVERDIDPDRLVTCDDCGHKGRCTCDDAYEDWRAEQ